MDTKDLKSTEGWLTIKDIMRDYKLSDMRVRMGIRTGQMKSVLVPKDGTKTLERKVSPEEVKKWREESEHHTKRTDGRNKFNIYMTKEEKVIVDGLFKTNKLELPIRLANLKKVVEK